MAEEQLPPYKPDPALSTRSVDEMWHFAKSPDWETRFMLARNTRRPKEILEFLLNDSHATVKHEALRQLRIINTKTSK
jgi:hypothetical protein